MNMTAEIVWTLIKMVIMVSCVVGGSFLGAILRKRKNAKLLANEKVLPK